MIDLFHGNMSSEEISQLVGLSKYEVLSLEKKLDALSERSMILAGYRGTPSFMEVMKQDMMDVLTGKKLPLFRDEEIGGLK